MATRTKKPTNEEELKDLLDEEEDEEEDEHVESLSVESDDLSIVSPPPKESYKGPTVTVFLPEIEGDGTEGLVVDQYEHVTIANERGETLYRIHRGEQVEVPVAVYIVLKEKYGKKI